MRTINVPIRVFEKGDKVQNQFLEGEVVLDRLEEKSRQGVLTVTDISLERVVVKVSRVKMSTDAFCIRVGSPIVLDRACLSILE